MVAMLQVALVAPLVESTGGWQASQQRLGARRAASSCGAHEPSHVAVPRGKFWLPLEKSSAQFGVGFLPKWCVAQSGLSRLATMGGKKTTSGTTKGRVFLISRLVDGPGIWNMRARVENKKQKTGAQAQRPSA